MTRTNGLRAWFVVAGTVLGCNSAPSPLPRAPAPPAPSCPPVAVEKARPPDTKPAPTPEGWDIRAFAPSSPPNPMPDWLAVRPLTTGEERAWLAPVAHKNKVVLLGESHWFGDVARLAQRIFLTLNDVDAFDLLTLELPYSSSVFFDHYVGLCNDDEADRFLTTVASAHIDNEELLALLQAVRSFNCQHPKRRLHLGSHDLEWAAARTLTTVLAPYFESFDASLHVPREAKREALDHAIADMRGWLPRARAKNHVGPEPFLTASFIDNVLTNLESTAYVWKHGNQMAFYRQKAIIRNLTSRSFLGHFFDGKVMIYGGAEHMAAHEQLADGGGFLVDGSYLAFDYAPTRGRVYAIRAAAFAYRFESMAGRRAPPEMGSGYGDLIERFNEAFAAGVVTQTAPYLMWGPLDPLESALAAQAASAHGFVLATVRTKIDASKLGEAWQRHYGAYDAVVAVADSPVLIALPH